MALLRLNAATGGNVTICIGEVKNGPVAVTRLCHHRIVVSQLCISKQEKVLLVKL